MSELPKAYEPKNYESTIYERWRTSGFFNPDNLPGKRREVFSISMPPSNATGILHIGHAMGMTIQDAIIRFERMRGKRALWLPGTDHAAIATQNVVEKELKKEGKRKEDLGREQFLRRVDAYVAGSQKTINGQVERIGASCDWSRERFTLDEGLSQAVNTAFVELYKDGLIYRGTRVVNWCPRCQSTLADDEIEYAEKSTTLVTFKYDKDFPLAISTTRPETKFGDTAVAVNPSDERYQQYVGKEYTVHFAGVERVIKIVADRAVDKVYGTGALGVTPAHSAIDERIAQREHLPSIKVIDEYGKMTKEAGKLAGLYVKEARKQLLEELRASGLVEKEESITHNLSLCYRCGTPIEPLPSKQWFVAVEKPTKRLGGKTLKQRALEVVKKKEIQFVPERFTNVYQQWMENLHDWCISRQIWYGHRIPVWYQGEEIAVGMDAPKKGEWTRDPDTLDTWFSSALWTFSSLGWPKKTKDLKIFHPTSVMETSYDIIFFWVARMILMSTYLMDEIPFKTVYLHGLVRDDKGRKMSKSLGNGIDPLVMADKYGADAVRLSLMIGTTPGNDVKLNEQKIAGYRNYVNKIWNIGRLFQMKFEKEKIEVTASKTQELADKWILSRSAQIVEEATKHFERFEFSQAGEKVYDFVWHEFADWYLEVTKLEGLGTVAHQVFGETLKLLHPFMPFVTETLWSQLGYSSTLLMIEEWPKLVLENRNETSERAFKYLQTFITVLRKERVQKKVPSDQLYAVRLEPDDLTRELVKEHRAYIEKLAKVKFE
ncbi:MAG: valine--tRNA ligase [bacterium]